MSKKEQSNFDKLKDLVNLIKGRKDIKTRLQVLSEPEKLETMSVLSKNQAHFIAVCNWLGEQPESAVMFEPLIGFGKSILEPNISVSGRGRDDVIKFVQAMNEAKAESKLDGKKEGKEKDA